ncbi:MAG: glycosyltransferase family 9 protein [Thermoguttaceae bacterium]
MHTEVDARRRAGVARTCAAKPRAEILEANAEPPAIEESPSSADLRDGSQLRLMAVQLASIRENCRSRSRWERLRSRLNKEFLHQDFMGKVRFLKSAGGEILRRIGGWTKSTSHHEIREDILESGVCIAVVCNGGMGDLVISSAFLDRFYRECGFPPIHVVVHPSRFHEAEFVFHNAPAVKRVLTHAEASVQPASTPYDVILKMGDFVSCEFVRDDRVRSLAPKLYDKLTAARQIQQPYRGFIDAAPSFDGLFATVAARSGLRRLDVLGWLAGIPFTQDHPLCLSPKADAYRYFVKDLDLANKPYITIHNGFDNIALRHVDTVTKAWPETHYVRFVERFKAKFPHVLVIQVGAKTSRLISNVDLCLLNTTSLHEAAWLLKHSLLHLDGDSGLVHLARALHTRSLVLFGPTNREYFRYAMNENVSSTVCNNCWWTTPDWVRSCPRGLSEPECMRSIDPLDVLRLAERHLSSLPSWKLSAEDSRSFTESSPAGNGQLTKNSHEPSFEQWRSDYIVGALKSASAPERKDPKIAVLCDSGPLLSQLRAMRYEPTVFDFAMEEDCSSGRAPARSRDTDPAGRTPNRDFGSLHNIPGENQAYDIVVVPSFTGRVAYPYFVIKEFSRILKEDGIMVIAFDFSSGQPCLDGGQNADVVDGFFDALGRLGTRGRLARSEAGGVVLRKLRDPGMTRCLPRTEVPKLHAL